MYTIIEGRVVMTKNEKKKYIFIAFLAVAVCIIVKYFSVVTSLAGVALSAVKPLIMGCAVAYIFNIIMDFFEKHYFPKSSSKFITASRRPVCLVVSFALTVAILLLILYIVIPEIISAFGVLYDEIPPFFTAAKDYVTDRLKEFPDLQKKLSEFEFDWPKIAEKAGSWVTTGVAGIVSSAVGIIGGFTLTVTNIVLAIIFAIYLLLRKDKLFRDISRIREVCMSREMNAKCDRFLRTANESFRSFFVGQFIEAIILGVLCFLGMKILKLPYAAMSGTLVGVTAFIPIVGAFIGAGVSAFIILTVDPMKALIFIIFLVILQQIEGNLIYPKVVGSSIGLPGIWVLAAVTVGGGLFGILGMVIGVPLAATIYKLIFDTLERREAAVGIKSVEKKPEEKKPVEKKPPHLDARGKKQEARAEKKPVQKKGKKK